MSSAADVPLRSQPLDDWLGWLETIHPVAIDMGLDRVSAVADRLGLRKVGIPLILVGGTNGKGSTVAMLSAIYRAAGYKVGAYTSPHITHFCERMRIDGVMADEQSVVDALDFIERGRAPDSLTYFEYTTLAAMQVFQASGCDVLVFEVGLGGRLDATNMWDADCSIVTSIGLDHEEYLGSDLSIIATEKAAIGRAGKPFVSGEHTPPASLQAYAVEHGFQFIDVGAMHALSLPDTAMVGDFQKRNAGCAVSAVNALQTRLPVPEASIASALMDTQLEGRFECVLVDEVQMVLDVAHNPAGAAVVAKAWQERFGHDKCDIIFASLADKDVEGVADALMPIVESWHCLTLRNSRAVSGEALAGIVTRLNANTSVMYYDSSAEAVNCALASARVGMRPVLVAGSFYTIAAVKSELHNRLKS